MFSLLGTIAQSIWVVMLGAMELLGRPTGRRARVGVVCIAAIGYVVGTVLVERAHETEIDALFRRFANAIERTGGGRSAQSPPSPSEAIDIAEPVDRSPVGSRALVAGTSRGSSARVWVIVHPLDTGAYWVQPPATRRGASWSTFAYFGGAGTADVGHSYEIVAVVNPADPLEEGEVLGSWPQAEFVSGSVTVTRRP